jgi:serine protease Do
MRTALGFAVLLAATTVSAQRSQHADARQNPGVDATRRTAITRAVERVAPAVVTVQTVIKERVAADMFESFFGGRSAQRTSAGLGSGFIIDAAGVVVTNAHVVAGASSVVVAMRDGATYDAKVLGADQQNDIAVLKIETKSPLPVATLGNSSDVIVGEWAIAIGNPFGFVLGNAEPSVTAGVISGTGRNLVGRTEGGGITLDMIQTDAAINPGNSGGPLVNALGEVIGMNTVIYSPSEGSVGLGFAVPINRVKRASSDLIAHGSIRQPWVGVRLKQPNANNPREAISMGAVVASVVPGSPAADAGIRPGDQILKAGDQAVRNYYAWESAQLDMRVGDRIPVHLKRGAEEVALTIVVADQPELTALKVQVMSGLKLVTLTPAIREERGVRSQSGALVYEISDALSAQWELQKGDVIVGIGQVPMKTAEQVTAAFEKLAGQGSATLYFERGGLQYRTTFAIR